LLVDLADDVGAVDPYPIKRTPFPSGNCSTKLLRLTSLPPFAIIFLEADSDIVIAQTVSL
jgi:hypothetical protein